MLEAWTTACSCANSTHTQPGATAICPCPVVATGDTHKAEQLSSWKTLVPCRKDERAVVEYLRSPERVYLAPFAIPAEIPLPIAA
jgi:hypothetical protein